MSSFFQRVRGVLGRKSRRQQIPIDLAENSTTKIRPSDETDDEDDGEVQSLTTYARRPQAKLRDQPRDTNSYDDDTRDRNLYQEGSTPLSNPQLRGTSTGLGSDATPNNNINRNATPTSNPSIRAGLPLAPQTPDPSAYSYLNPISSPTNNLPSTSDGLPPDTNRNQTISPSTNPIPQSSIAGSFPPDMNLDRTPQTINPNSTLVGFPPSMNPLINQRSKNAPSLFNQPFAVQQNYFRQRTRRPFSTNLISFQPRHNTPRVELDYPIENVIIDGNIPSSIAHKINQAVEYDRFGNPYRYAHKPTPQLMSIRNNQRTPRRFTSHHGATRHIREINHENYYPQVNQTQSYNTRQPIICNTPQVIQKTQNYTDLQPVIINTPQITCQIICSQYDSNPIPMPINHYTAHALLNDPMQYY